MKKTLYQNAGIMFFAIVIVATIIISDVTQMSLDQNPLKLVVMLMALFTIGESIRQAIKKRERGSEFCGCFATLIGCKNTIC